MSIHLDDIKFALNRGHVAVIEDAFRALVGWPDEDTIEGADARERKVLLVQVCKALRENDRQMPGNIITLIEDVGELFGGTYRNGAGAVLSDIEYWRNRVGGDA